MQGCHDGHPGRILPHKSGCKTHPAFKWQRPQGPTSPASKPMPSSAASSSSATCSRSHLWRAAASFAAASALLPAWYAATPSSSSRRTYLQCRNTSLRNTGQLASWLHALYQAHPAMLWPQVETLHHSLVMIVLVSQVGHNTLSQMQSRPAGIPIQQCILLQLQVHSPQVHTGCLDVHTAVGGCRSFLALTWPARARSCRAAPSGVPN